MSDEASSSDARVALVAVNWNCDDLLFRCLESVARQTRPPDRVLVIDNGSRRRPDVARSILPLELVPLDRNLGFAAAANIGIQQGADCHWIALVNPDAELQSDWLESMLRAAGRHPQFSFFASQLLCAARPECADGLGDAYHTSGLAWRIASGQPAAELAGIPREVFSACAAAALYRRDALEQVGGFDPRYFCYFEDVDLGFRLRLAGHRCLYVPAAVARHIGSASAGRGSDFAVYHGHRNLVWTYWKNMPDSLFWRYLPQHLLANMAALAWFSWRGQARAIWRAKWDALRGLPAVWRQRAANRSEIARAAPALRPAMQHGWLAPYLRHAGRRRHPPLKPGKRRWK